MRKITILSMTIALGMMVCMVYAQEREWGARPGSPRRSVTSAPDPTVGTLTFNYNFNGVQYQEGGEWKTWAIELILTDYSFSLVPRGTGQVTCNITADVYANNVLLTTVSMNNTVNLHKTGLRGGRYDFNFVPTMELRNVRISNAQIMGRAAANPAGNANSSSSLWGNNSSSGGSNSSSGSSLWGNNSSSTAQSSQTVQTAGRNSGYASEFQANQASGGSSGSGSSAAASASSGTSQSSSVAQQEYNASVRQLEAARSSQQQSASRSSQSSSSSSGISAQQRANNERALTTQRQALDSYTNYQRQSFQQSTQRVENMLAAVDADNREREARWAEEARREAAEREAAEASAAETRRREAEAAEIRRLEAEVAASRRRMEEAAAADRRNYLNAVRQGILTDYPDSKVPISSDNIPTDEIWYFAYAAGSGSATVTEVFPVTRYNDGTWIYKPSLLREINEAGLTGNVSLVGWFSTRAKAQEALNDFKKRAQSGEMTLKTVTYAGKVQQQSGLWGGGTSGNAAGQSGSSLWGN